MKQHPTKIDIAVLIGLPVISLILSLLFRSPYHVFTTLFFYGLPSLYLIFRYKEYFYAFKGLIYVLIVATPIAIIVDYIGISSGLWFDPYSIFVNRFLGVIPLEDLIWMYSATYLIMIFYQTFLDIGKKELINKKIIKFIIPALIALAIFFVLVLTNNSQIFFWHSKYTYTILCTIFFLLPSIIFLLFFPHFLKKSLSITVYFFYVTTFLELTTTYLNQWVFKGEYIIKPFSLFGFGLVSFEELFFVGIVGPIAAIAFYEFFDDDLV
ncbi:MAG: hypothetical protein NT161_03485 [Candidatus Nomurabacteria bacterium]|nr:hypothetical protein [Candidatus Nomurabacteria bacterium]